MNHPIFISIKAKTARSVRYNERGIGLVEILITLVLISIGFLAGARMQVEGMRFSQSSYHRSQAYFMASDIIDRMRANLAGVNAGAYDNIDTNSPVNNPQCNVNSCTATQLAQHDIFEWRNYLFPENNSIPVLPSSDSVPAIGRIIARGNSEFTVHIEWFNGDDVDQVDFAFMAQSLNGN